MKYYLITSLSVAVGLEEAFGVGIGENAARVWDSWFSGAVWVCGIAEVIGVHKQAGTPGADLLHWLFEKTGTTVVLGLSGILFPLHCSPLRALEYILPSHGVFQTESASCCLSRQKAFHPVPEPSEGFRITRDCLNSPHWPIWCAYCNGERHSSELTRVMDKGLSFKVLHLPH